MSTLERFFCVGLASLALGSVGTLSERHLLCPRMASSLHFSTGRNFAGFDTLLEKHGINHDPDGVFKVEKGMLHVSGQEFGGLVTQKEFGITICARSLSGARKCILRAWANLAIAAFNTTLPDRSRCGLA